MSEFHIDQRGRVVELINTGRGGTCVKCIYRNDNNVKHPCDRYEEGPVDVLCGIASHFKEVKGE